MGSNQPLRVLIWCAVSTEPQADDDKFSLPNQRADGLAFVERIGGVLVGVLEVPGHSRYYRSLDVLAAKAKADGIDAFERLTTHFERKDFDVLYVRDSNRFARKASLMHYIIETVVEDCRARIYSQNDGWIDESNYHMFGAMAGFKTAHEVAALRRFQIEGLNRNARNGIPTAVHVPVTHRRVRNERGKTVTLELNPDAKAFVDALTDLFLHGLSYVDIARQLNAMGFRTVNGKLHSPQNVNNMLHNPVLWGHIGRHSDRRRFPGDTREWVFDDSVEPPPGVIIARNAHPAVWAGELADRVRDELRRRADLPGRYGTASVYRFSKVAVCGVCGATLSVLYSHGKRRGLKCWQNRGKGTALEPRCPNNKRTPEAAIQRALEYLLQPLLDGVSDDVFSAPVQTQADSAQARLDALSAQIANLGAQIEALIFEQRIANPALLEDYRRQINALADQRAALQTAYEDIASATQTTRERSAALQHSVAELRDLTFPMLWTRPDREVNALLRTIMGDARLVFVGSDLIDIRPHNGNL